VINKFQARKSYRKIIESKFVIILKNGLYILVKKEPPIMEALYKIISKYI